ncbi:hypothetical protein [Qipengyuania flava]|uniref:hypothetical protein n=1 Tax=Qipengyuania flava TaxID=192812 RepID=UPI00273E4AE9|nr:hypothetical protein [Qipengyuania flava]
MKQAEHFESYKKDIFADLGDGKFAQEVKDLTIRLLGAFEDQEAVKVAEFSDDAFARVMTEISEMERSLGGEWTLVQVRAAKSFLADLDQSKVQ